MQRHTSAFQEAVLRLDARELGEREPVGLRPRDDRRVRGELADQPVVHGRADTAGDVRVAGRLDEVRDGAARARLVDEERDEFAREPIVAREATSRGVPAERGGRGDALASLLGGEARGVGARELGQRAAEVLAEALVLAAERGTRALERARDGASGGGRGTMGSNQARHMRA